MKQWLLDLYKTAQPFVEPVLAGVLIAVVGAIFWLSVFGIEDGFEVIMLCGAAGALAGAIWNLWRMLRRGA